MLKRGYEQYKFVMHRVCLLNHPLDLNSSKATHEAARLYMQKHKVEQRRGGRRFLCPGLASHLSSWAGATILLCLNISTWIFELVTSVIFISDFHGVTFNYSSVNQTVSLQTRTVDLHFSLMILMFIFYLLYLLYSTSWRYVGTICRSSAWPDLQYNNNLVSIFRR